MTDLAIGKTSALEGTLKAPPSKSYTIRALVAGLLSDGMSKITDPLYSLDTKACMKAIGAFGAGINHIEEGLAIEGTGGRINVPEHVLDTENSGTTIRILTGVAGLAHGKITLTGDASIRRRPIEDLLSALKQLGVEVESSNGFPPHSVKGPLAGGVCRIRGDISSQFISSILMSAPYAIKDTVVKVTSPLKSRPYVDLTLSVLDRFSVRVENKDYKSFKIGHDQAYAATDYTVEGDYSSAAFLLAAASIVDSDVTVKNLFQESKQADKKILGILRQMGAELIIGEDYVHVKGGGALNAITMDLSDAPDLVPICSVLASVAEGETVIENVEHARLKECDRIHAMAAELGKMGANVTERKDGLIIRGGKLKGGAVIESWHDHRIVMSMAVAALAAEGKTTIKDAEVAAVTYPDFIKDIQKIGVSTGS
ncbi:MAG: 3-phosphoshikimate 1-carboxyvinyltransferase [Candidatus Altiarchaeota archaeon]